MHGADIVSTLKEGALPTGSTREPVHYGIMGGIIGKPVRPFGGYFRYEPDGGGLSGRIVDEQGVAAIVGVMSPDEERLEFVVQRNGCTKDLHYVLRKGPANHYGEIAGTAKQLFAAVAPLPSQDELLDPTLLG